MALPARNSVLSPRKRRQILEGARAAFADHGYERASVDLVASRAGVSKATVYNHFQDKQALFLAAFSEEADAMRAELAGVLEDAPDGDLESVLRGVGERLVRIMIAPSNLALYRHTVAEACRSPAFGELLFARGPEPVYAALAAYLRRCQASGKVRLDDGRAAAIQFAQLCQGELVLRAQLGITPRPSPRAVRETVRRAVRTFLAAYRA
ncbi:MAG: TetR/AcrR family transcriptional regulator [Anaeromyxobacteraceae bacterium]